MVQEHLACPFCRHEGPAHAFKMAGGFGWDVRDTPLRRRCPRCRRADKSQAFRRVAAAAPPSRE